MAQFRELSLRAQAHGVPQGDLSAELTCRDVERLGCDAEQAQHIVRLLSRERALEESLIAAERRGLYRKFAELSDSGFFDTHAEAKAAALSVMENLTASQSDVDAALAALVSASSYSGSSADASAVLAEVLNHMANTAPAPAFGTLGGE